MYLSKKFSLKVLALLLVFSMLFSACNKKITPSVMLDEATEKQEKNYSQNRAPLPDFERFNTKPIEQSGKLTFLDSNDTSMSFLKNAAMTFNAKTDYLSKKLMMDLGFIANGVTMDGNQLYVSEDTIALSAPLLYNEKKYITMNPATFVTDWNNSPLGMDSPMPTDINIPELIVSMFDVKSTEELSNNFTTSFNEQLKIFNEKRVFGETTQESLKLTGTEETYSIVTYTVAAEALQEFYLNTVNIYVDNIISYYESNQPMMDFYETTGTDMEYFYESVNDLKETLSQVSFTSDVTVKNYINKKDLIHRIDVENLSVKTSFDNELEPKEFIINIVHNFTGEKHVYDSSKTTINMTDKITNSEIKIVVGRVAPADKNKFTEDWTLDVFEKDVLKGTIKFLMNWDLVTKEGNNFEMSFSFKDETYNSEPMNFSLVGNLMSSEKAIDFTNGVFEINIEGTMFKIGVDFKVQNIIGTEISIDLDDSKKLTDFTMEELSRLFQMSY